MINFLLVIWLLCILYVSGGAFVDLIRKDYTKPRTVVYTEAAITITMFVLAFMFIMGIAAFFVIF